MTAIGTLCEIIAQRGKAAKAFYQDCVGFDQLAKTDLIKVSGKVQSIFCDGCSDPHDADIVFEDGCYGFYCHDAGFVQIDDKDTDAIKPSVEMLVADLASAFKCRRRKSTPIRADTWRVGTIDTPGGDLAIYFHPSLLSIDDVADVQAALLGETKSTFQLILTAIGALPVSGAKAAPLFDVVELAATANELRPLVDLRSIVGAPFSKMNGRPNTYESDLRHLFEQRKNSGIALPGLNAEARAIREVYNDLPIDKPAPSLSAIKRYLSEFRTGS